MNEKQMLQIGTYCRTAVESLSQGSLTLGVWFTSFRQTLTHNDSCCIRALIGRRSVRLSASRSRHGGAEDDLTAFVVLFVYRHTSTCFRHQTHQVGFFRFVYLLTVQMPFSSQPKKVQRSRIPSLKACKYDSGCRSFSISKFEVWYLPVSHAARTQHSRQFSLVPPIEVTQPGNVYIIYIALTVTDDRTHTGIICLRSERGQTGLCLFVSV